MITVGGSSFTPGSPESLSISGLDATQSTAVFRYSTLEVSGSLAGAVWTFAFTANDTAVFNPTPNRFDCQIVYGDGSMTPVVLRTGERKTGTDPVVPPGTTRVSSITAGTGITCTPNPITDAGTVALSATLGNLTGVSISSGVAAGDRLEFGGSVWADTTPEPMMPRPGVAYRIVIAKVWNPLLSTPALVDVYRESFFEAAGGLAPVGDIELKSSGVSFVVGGSGYSEDSGVRYGMFNDNVRKQIGFSVSSSGALNLVRGVDVDNTGSGYFCSCDYVES